MTDRQRKRDRRQCREAKQAGEVRARWAWVEPWVWTERMLTALEQGVKGGKWFSLIDKVCSRTNAAAAFERVKANGGAAGVDHQTVEMFEQRLDENTEDLRQALKDGRYQPQAVRRVWIPKPGARRNGRWEFRRCGTGWCKTAIVARAGTDLRAGLRGTQLRVSARTRVQGRPATSGRAAEGGLHVGGGCRPEKLLRHDSARPADGADGGEDRGWTSAGADEAFLKQGVLEDMRVAGQPEAGTPQGAVLSPLLVEHLSRPAGPPDGRRRDSRWCAMRTTS